MHPGVSVMGNPYNSIHTITGRPEFVGTFVSIKSGASETGWVIACDSGHSMPIVTDSTIQAESPGTLQQEYLIYNTQNEIRFKYEQLFYFCFLVFILFSLLLGVVRRMWPDIYVNQSIAVWAGCCLSSPWHNSPVSFCFPIARAYIFIRIVTIL